jgi:hypothetical protein
LQKKLLAYDVEFILIEGYAVIFHGYVRTTGGMDVWLKPTNENKEKLLSLLEAEGIHKEDIEFLRRKNFSDMQAFHIGSPPKKIDFITKISGVEYPDADKQKFFFDADSFQIPIIHFNHLVTSKITSTRAKDKADVEELQKARRKKN